MHHAVFKFLSRVAQVKKQILCPIYAGERSYSDAFRKRRGTSGYLNGISSACSFSRNARTIPDMPETGSDLGFMNVAMNLVQKSAQPWLLSSGAIHAGMSLHANAGIEELKRQ